MTHNTFIVYHVFMNEKEQIIGDVEFGITVDDVVGRVDEIQQLLIENVQLVTKQKSGGEKGQTLEALAESNIQIAQALRDQGVSLSASGSLLASIVFAAMG